MRRRAFSGLTLLSFILAILVGVVWLRSHVQHDLITRRVQNEAFYQEHMVGWSLGRITAGLNVRTNDAKDIPPVVSPAAMQWHWEVVQPVYLRSGRSLANDYGFSLVAVDRQYEPPVGKVPGATFTHFGFVLPLWVAFCATMILPAIAWRRKSRRVLPDPVDVPAPV